MAQRVGYFSLRNFSKYQFRTSVITKQTCRTYARSLYRKPVRTLTPDEAQNLALGKTSTNHLAEQEELWEKSTTTTRFLANDNVNVSSDRTTNDDREDGGDEGRRLPFGMRYEKLRDGDKRFGPLIMAARSRKDRKRQKLILLEGTRLIREAIEAKIKIKSLYFTNLDVVLQLPLEEVPNATLYKVMKSNMKIWSDVKEPQGIMAVCHMPTAGELNLDESSQVPIILICDQIREPGNMGTILRTAAAVGCQLVLLTKGCVDFWDPKVLRSGAGAHFKTRVLPYLGWEHIGNYLQPDTNIYLADNRADVPVTASRHYKHAVRKILKEQSDKYFEKSDDDVESVEVDESFLDEASVQRYEHVPLAVESVFETDFNVGSSTAVVIGGETEGLSKSARKLCFDRQGGVIHLPMAAGVESLNAATATAVIMFEIKRQLLLRKPINNNAD